MAMSAAQKNSFVKNRVQLINTITPSAEFLGHLRQGNHISDSMEEEIMVCTQLVVATIILGPRIIIRIIYPQNLGVD